MSYAGYGIVAAPALHDRDILIPTNVTLRSNRSLNRSLNRNLTAAAYILTMVALRKPLRFEPQQSV